MAVKKCCIKNCHSCSVRKEDIGVTYHKFPKDVSLRETWISVTRHKHLGTTTTFYVCSRHFCKSDFQVYKDSKYVLKSGAVPSIFSWTVKKTTMDLNGEAMSINTSRRGASFTHKEPDMENVDAIKKFIEDQEREIQEQKCEDSKIKIKEEFETDANKINFEEPMAVAASVMDFILSESETRILTKKEDKQCFSPNDKSTMALSVGSKVEAKDYGEFWYPVQIVEVDYDEMEVLVHYENASKKHDEWINVSSPRLRPLTNTTQSPTVEVETEMVKTKATTVKEEMKEEDEKPKLKFVVGERCLARWRDNRRFMATVNQDLGNGHYEVIFDDGFLWKCTTGRLYKLKKNSEGSNDPIDSSSSSSTPLPIPYEPSSLATTNGAQSIPYHTHLFDPTRDYLGSKNERREKKRKLNIKEIFNIGQKKRRKERSPKKHDSNEPKVVNQRRPYRRKKINMEHDMGGRIKTEMKSEIPDAVASIIGTMAKEIVHVKEEIFSDDETAILKTTEGQKELETVGNIPQAKVNCSATKEELDLSDTRNSTDPVLEEETTLENFETIDDQKHEEVIDRIKEAIIKLEDGISKAERVSSPKTIIKISKEIEKPKEITKRNEIEKKKEIEKPKEIDKPKEVEKPKEMEISKEIDEPIHIEIKDETGNIETAVETKTEETVPSVLPDESEQNSETHEGKGKKSLSKIKKSKKLRLLQEKKVKKQVEKVKNELEEMKRQMAEMREQMFLNTGSLSPQKPEMPESFLLPGEWCCRWVNGQPVGKVSEIESEVRIDKSNKPVLPRRSVQVEDKRLPEGWTKHMVRRSFGHSAGKWDVVLVSPENRRFHMKTEIRNYLESDAGAELKQYENALLDFGVHLKLARRMGWVTNTGTEEPVTPLPAGLISTTSPLVKKRKLGEKKIKAMKERKIKKVRRVRHHSPDIAMPSTSIDGLFESQDNEIGCDNLTLEDGYVYVGALKVQIIENLLRCPAEGCLKNFRNKTLLKMHIKHYHRDLRKMLGTTPKVLDLAYARARPTKSEVVKPRDSESKIIKVKIPRPPKRVEDPKIDMNELNSELQVDIPLSPNKEIIIPKAMDSPKLRDALIKKPIKRPKVLLPVRRLEPEMNQMTDQINIEEAIDEDSQSLEILDFETAISTHTVTKPLVDRSKLKKRGFGAKIPFSEDEDWLTVNSDVETRSSFPRSGTPDSKNENKAVNAVDSNEEQKEPMYTYTETGERIKIVQMKREEIINCHCGFREEDGLMVQCELCLCWQHALCHNIQKESEVPDKYTCSICLNPRRGRRSKRFVHDQDRLYEGLLPGARPCENLRRAHELAGNLLRVRDVLHALRVKSYVATKKDHPKLYLWAKDWESTELTITQEKMNSDYSDLNIIINNIEKENHPVKDDVKDISMDNTDVPMGPQTVLSGLLSSPEGGPLELPISTSELERLAKSVQEEPTTAPIPQPEAAIENGACRERLLKHIQRCQALIDARLDSIEAQVAELESQDPSFEDDETADFFPRTKQTIQMLMRDLDTMEELASIT